MATTTAPRTGEGRTGEGRPAGARSGRSHPDGRSESRTKVLLYGLAAVLAVAVFLAPLLWALLRAFQPNAVITAAPNSMICAPVRAATSQIAPGGLPGLPS